MKNSNENLEFDYAIKVSYGLNFFSPLPGWHCQWCALCMCERFVHFSPATCFAPNIIPSHVVWPTREAF